MSWKLTLNLQKILQTFLAHFWQRNVPLKQDYCFFFFFLPSGVWLAALANEVSASADFYKSGMLRDFFFFFWEVTVDVFVRVRQTESQRWGSKRFSGCLNAYDFSFGACVCVISFVLARTTGKRCSPLSFKLISTGYLSLCYRKRLN